MIIRTSFVLCALYFVIPPSLFTKQRTKLKRQSPETTAELIRIFYAKEILTQRRKDINQYNFFIHHRGAVPTLRGKVQNISGRSDLLLTLDKKAYLTFFDNRHLFMWMIMFWSDQKRLEAKPAHHHSMTN